FIKNTKDSICIGAATDINTIADSFLMTSSPGVLSEAALAHSTYTIRNRATIGGNLCNASPCADMTLPLLVLDAALVAVRKNDSRTILVQDFFCGVNCSALKPDQMLQKIVIPLPSKFFGASFLKLGRHQTAVDMAIVNVATSLWRKKEKCTAARIALGSVGPIAFRAKSAEAWLSGKKLNNKNIQQAAKMAADESNPIDDNRATGKYRKEMAAVLVEKSLETSLQRSGQ
ncbi:MAG: hypothetical protein GY729_10705, partial [Desulfobacteraceae bacterium]|nr:hypothetical protein [Desulfobacteraceae bacterium]